MDQIEIESLNLSDMKQTFVLWEAYEKLEGNPSNFCPVVKKCLEEIGLYKASTYKLCIVYTELIHWIEDACKNFPQEIIYMIKLFGELVSRGIGEDRKNEKISKLLTETLIKEITKENISNRKDIVEISFEVIRTFYRCDSLLLTLKRNKDLVRGFSVLICELSLAVIGFEHFEYEFRFLIVVRELVNRSIDQFVLLDEEVRAKVYPSVVKMCLDLIQYTQGQHQGEIGNVFSVLVVVLPSLIDNGNDLLKFINVEAFCDKVSTSKWPYGEDLIASILNKCFQMLGNPSEAYLLCLNSIIKILLTPELTEDLYKQYTETASRIKYKNIESLVISISEIKENLLNSKHLINKIEVLEAFSSLFGHSVRIVEFKILLKLAYDHPELSINVLKLLLNCCENIDRPNGHNPDGAENKSFFESLTILGGAKTLLLLYNELKSQSECIIFLKVIEKITLNYYNMIELFDEDFFIIFKVMSKEKKFYPMINTIELIVTIGKVLSNLKYTKYYEIALENIVLNNKMIYFLSEECIIKLLDITFEHFLNYCNCLDKSRIGNICKFFNSIIKTSNKEYKRFTYPNYFFTVKNILYKFEKEIPTDTYFFILNKLTEEVINDDVDQFFSDFFYDAKIKKKLKPHDEDFLGNLFIILKKCSDKNNNLDSIILSFILEIFEKSIRICNPDIINNRIIDFKTEYSREEEDLNFIQKKLEEILNPQLKDHICKEIINFLTHFKIKKILQFSQEKKNEQDALNLEENKKKQPEKSFIDLITNRLFETYQKNFDAFEKIIFNIIQTCNSKKTLSLLIIKADSFPGWTFPFFNANRVPPGIFLNLIAYLFSNMNEYSNFNKLRALLFNLIKKNKFDVALGLYKLILVDESSRVHYKSIKYFIEMMNIAEDIFRDSGSIEQNFELFKDIVLNLIDLSINVKFSITFPSFPGISLYEVIDNYSNQPDDDAFIYFRDGGISRQLLKFIFILLSIEFDPQVAEKLLQVFEKHKTSSVETEWKAIKSDKNVKRLSFFPEKSKKNCEDLVYIYTYIELITIIKQHQINILQDNAYDTLAYFTKKYKIWKRIKILSSKEHTVLPTQYLKLSQVLNTYFASEVYNQRDQNFDVASFIRTLTPSSYSEVSENIKKRSENSKDLNSILTVLPPYIEIYLKILTSLKMEILSNKYMIDIDTYDYRSYIPEPSLSEMKSSSEFSVNEINKIDLVSIIAIQKKNLLLKSLSNVYGKPNEDQGKFYLRSGYDSIGRKPFLTKKVSKCPEFPSRIASIKDSLYQDFIDDSKIRASLSTIGSARKDSIYLRDSEYFDIINEEEEQTLVSQIAPKVELECEMILMKGTYYGTISIDDQYIIFHSKSIDKPFCEPTYRSGDQIEVIANSSPKYQIKKEIIKIWNISDITEIIPRRYLHTYCAIELYFSYAKSRYINFFTKEKYNEAYSKLISIEKYNIVVLKRKNILKYTKLWKTGEISNFEYLMIVNKYAGRSFNDFTQYPVFPWILRDYESPELDYNNTKIYRKLQYPISAQNKKSRATLESKWKDLSKEKYPFHYGTHYSSGAIVWHYLIRLQPFTQKAIELQDGKFDAPDRLFLSVKKAYNNCCFHLSDTKELIPEFFYLPEMFKNINNEDFKKRQNGKTPNDVVLPPWAKGSEFNFIRIHRKALESPYVSSNIHNWIDLIFGYKQRKKNGEKAFNIFYPITYEKNFNDIIRSSPPNFKHSILEQAFHFGQTPIQLFNAQHPKRDPIFTKTILSEQALRDPLKIQLKRAYDSELPFIILFYSQWIVLVKVSRTVSIIKMKYNNDNYPDLDSKKEIELKKLPNVVNLIAAVYKDEFIATAGYESFDIYINSLTGDLMEHYKFHLGPVTCIHGSNTLISGSKDSIVVIWNASKILLHGHFSAITSVCLYEEYSMVISSSTGIVLLHDTRTAEVTKQFQIDCIGLYPSSYGCFVLETSTSYEFFYINSQRVGGTVKDPNSKCCVIGDCLVFTDKDLVKFIDTIDQNFSDILNQSSTGAFCIAYDKKKDVLMICDKIELYTLKIIKF